MVSVRNIEMAERIATIDRRDAGHILVPLPEREVPETTDMTDIAPRSSGEEDRL
jgi:hypothetical protein